MTNYPVIQIQPNHADHISGYKESFIQKMMDSSVVVAQPKYDGERMLIHLDHGKVYCTSRRHSKKTDRFMENQDKLPLLQQVVKKFGQNFEDFGYTVLDCECYCKDWSTVVGILHSLPERAIELQKEDIPHFAVFDCLWLDGKDVRDEAYLTRFMYASQIVDALMYEPIHMVPLMNKTEDGWITKEFYPKFITNTNRISKYEDLTPCMNAAIDLGFEGIVVKSFDLKYYDKGASLKCKKFETVDCVVCGYQDGRGKYEGSVGALEIGYYDATSNKVIKISKVNCGTDEDRADWNTNREALLNTVVEVKCQEITEKSLRHPVLIRRRPDKDYKMCTKETIFKE